MACEEWLVGRHILDADDIALPHLDDLVDKEHRITVRQKSANLDIVEQGLFVGVVDGSLNFHALDFAAHFLGQCGVDRVAGAGGDYFAEQRTAKESEVTDKVEQLVARRFIVVGQRTVVDISELLDIFVGHIHQIGQTVELFLTHRRIVDNDGVVEIAPLDEIGVDKRLYLTHEDESAARSNLFGEVVKTVESGILIGENRRIEVHHDVDAEMVVGKNNDRRACFLVAIIVFFGFKLLKACLLDFLHIDFGTSVENRHLGSVDLDDDIVEAHGKKSGHGMFDSRDTHIAAGDDGATVGSHDILRHGGYCGLPFKIDATELIAVVLGSRFEGSGDVEAGMQTFSADGKFFCECELLHYEFIYLFFLSSSTSLKRSGSFER